MNRSDNIKFNIKYWWLRDAKWYQIWYPQNGFVGGCICGFILAVIVILCMELYNGI